MAAVPRAALYTLLALLIIDALLEVAFLGTMVGYLHRDHPMHVIGANGAEVILKGKPLHIGLNQGHTSNGTAGTAIILVGLFGFILLTQGPKIQHRFPRYYIPVYTAWAVLIVMALLLTLAALIYTFVVTNQSAGQHIHLAGLTSPIRYPYDNWVPQTWYGAVLKDLTFAPDDSGSVVVDGASISYSTRSDVEGYLRIFNGWKWNLIPLFLIQLAVTPLLVLEYLSVRRGYNTAPSHDKEEMRSV